MQLAAAEMPASAAVGCGHTRTFQSQLVWLGNRAVPHLQSGESEWPQCPRRASRVDEPKEAAGPGRTRRRRGCVSCLPIPFWGIDKLTKQSSWEVSVARVLLERWSEGRAGFWAYWSWAARAEGERMVKSSVKRTACTRGSDLLGTPARSEKRKRLWKTCLC